MVFPSDILEIPDWRYDGLLPAVLDSGTTSSGRSPYAADASALVERFGHTKSRRDLIRKFFAFRNEVRNCGWHHGFQWLNGSFLTDVERLERGRAPGDIDVVSFLYSSEATDLTAARHMASEEGHDDIKSRLQIDSYFVDLDVKTETVIDSAMYWQSIWGHRKGDYREKGFVKVTIDSCDDAALSLLDRLDKEA